MKIAFISDTHLRHLRNRIQVPDADLLIHSGDACVHGDEEEVEAFFDWFGRLPHRHKVFVAGNHDWLFEKNPALARTKVPKNVQYLQDSMVEIEGLKIYGSPWQPEFCEWAFNLPRGWQLRKKWEAVPTGIDILVTHGPPMGILDWSSFGDEHAGCEDLRRELLRIKPKIHAFGHIHGSYGILEWGGTTFVNAATCDEAYEPTHAPIVVELEPGKTPVVLSGPSQQSKAVSIKASKDMLWP